MPGQGNHNLDCCSIVCHPSDFASWGQDYRKNSFDVSLNLPVTTHNVSGLIRVDGLVQGHIDGTVMGVMHATIRSNANILMKTGSAVLTDEAKKRSN